ncbi:MAG: snoK, partial [Pseudomonadota bacterium]
MASKAPSSNLGLVGENARAAGIDQPWEQDNQAWWDWYVSLADNDADHATSRVDVPDLPVVDLPADDVIIAQLREPYP